MEQKKGRINKRLLEFMKWSSRTAGSPSTFVTALLIFGGWLLIGLAIGIDDTWLLIINTVGTLNASLMVFIIQSTQYRETKAINIKLDEVILALKETEKSIAMIEEFEDEELEEIRKTIGAKKKKQTEK